MSPLTPLSKKARAAEEQRIRVCKLVIGLGDLGSAVWGQLDHTDWRNLILAVEVRLPFRRQLQPRQFLRYHKLGQLLHGTHSGGPIL